MTLAERGERFDETVDVVPVFFLDFRARLEKVNGAVLAVLVRAGGDAREIFPDRSLHRPDERMNRTNHEHGSLLVPAGFAQRFAAIRRRMRLERPRGVRSEFRGNAQRTEKFLRFLVARDHQRIVNVALAHPLNEPDPCVPLRRHSRAKACSPRKRGPASRSSSWSARWRTCS